MSEFDDYCEHCTYLSKNELNDELISAMGDNDVDKIKFLLASPNLKEHADIHFLRDESFRMLCINRDLSLLHYFIYDLNIERTSKIEQHLESYKSSYKYAGSMDCVEFIEKAQELFDKRDLKNEISLELEIKKTPIKKSKI
jgi:hypothetical protein